jgi:hypothetical protein
MCARSGRTTIDADTYSPATTGCTTPQQGTGQRYARQTHATEAARRRDFHLEGSRRVPYAALGCTAHARAEDRFIASNPRAILRASSPLIGVKRRNVVLATGRRSVGTSCN